MSQSRKIRFAPDDNNIIELRNGTKVTRGLIRDESFNGYCVVTNDSHSLNIGDLVDMSINSIQNGRGEVVRIDPFDDVLVKIGVSILS